MNRRRSRCGCRVRELHGREEAQGAPVRACAGGATAGFRGCSTTMQRNEPTLDATMARVREHPCVAVLPAQFLVLWAEFLWFRANPYDRAQARPERVPRSRHRITVRIIAPIANRAFLPFALLLGFVLCGRLPHLPHAMVLHGILGFLTSAFLLAL